MLITSFAIDSINAPNQQNLARMSSLGEHLIKEEYKVWNRALSLKEHDRCPSENKTFIGHKNSYQTWDQFMILPCCHLKYVSCKNHKTCCVCRANVHDMFNFLRHFIAPPATPAAAAIFQKILETGEKAKVKSSESKSWYWSY